MNNDVIGLKISDNSISAKTIAIVRKYNNASIGQIRKNILEGKYVLFCSYTDRNGLKSVIECYEELKENGIAAEVYELDNEITTMEFLKNIDETYNEISNEIDNELNEMVYWAP